MSNVELKLFSLWLTVLLLTYSFLYDLLSKFDGALQRAKKVLISCWCICWTAALRRWLASTLEASTPYAFCLRKSVQKSNQRTWRRIGRAWFPIGPALLFPNPPLWCSTKFKKEKAYTKQKAINRLNQKNLWICWLFCKSLCQNPIAVRSELPWSNTVRQLFRKYFATNISMNIETTWHTRQGRVGTQFDTLQSQDLGAGCPES